MISDFLITILSSDVLQFQDMQALGVVGLLLHFYFQLTVYGNMFCSGWAARLFQKETVQEVTHVNGC